MLDDREMLVKRCAELNKFSSLKSIMMLEVLACSNSFESITDIAEVSGLSNSTIHRIIQELVQSEYVRKNNEHKYCLGLNALALGTRIRKTDLISEAASIEMNRLNDLSNETIHLIVLDKNQGRYIAKCEAKNQIGLRSRIGWTIPLYCTAGGKVLLAYQTEEWLRSYFDSTSFERFTDNTICEEKSMQAELAAIRRNGFGMDNEEHHLDVVCIAAPIFDSQNRIVATVGISAPAYRFSKDKALSYKDELLASARRISERLRQE